MFQKRREKWRKVKIIESHVSMYRNMKKMSQKDLAKKWMYQDRILQILS